MGKRKQYNKSTKANALVNGVNSGIPIKKPVAVKIPANKLDGARFRWLNESLYTEPSSSSFETFQKDPALFQTYHAGFRAQSVDWPVNPVDECCDFITARLPLSSTVGDFGCGDAKIASQLAGKMTVHSFDLVSVNPLVTACNIANVPLPDSSLDVAVFSLSLMGTDWPKFIAEAQRCLKIGGILYIAEVQSRLTDFAGFVNGFKPAFQITKAENDKAKYFVRVILKKTSNKALALPSTLLKPCVYKKR